ncbi:hypothetical protein [Rhizobium mesoamericanum]|uniref:hypothetical protein n=1 Tax=Rhizobium mesoamericanum TaxID=1079800 RepID=UPI000416B520|nr:hypothetical protein [Rhizobium mesoamericanum]
MPWAIAVSFLVGAICAVRLPVLLFTLIVALIVVVFAVIGHGLGNSFATVAVWAIIYAAALEAGYLFVHWLFYLFYVKRTAQKTKQASPEIRSKYSAE